MMIYFVGTGAGGSPGSRRWRPSQLVILNNMLLLVDCGVGCHYRLSDKGYLTEIDAVFITHSHMDHFLGLPELLFQAHLEGRTKELLIYAPRIVERTFKAVAPHLYTALGFKFTVKPIIPGKDMIIKGHRLTPYLACHWTAEEAYSLKISTQGNRLTIGFTGDTAEPCKHILEGFKGVDILVHEATCDEAHKEVCRQYAHSTNHEAMETAVKLGSKILVLNHIDEYFNQELNNELKSMEKRLKIIAPSDQEYLFFT